MSRKMWFLSKHSCSFCVSKVLYRSRLKWVITVLRVTRIVTILLVLIIVNTSAGLKCGQYIVLENMWSILMCVGTRPFWYTSDYLKPRHLLRMWIVNIYKTNLLILYLTPCMEGKIIKIITILHEKFRISITGFFHLDCLETWIKMFN